MSAEDEKRQVGEAAAALVQDGMTVGLGTGSTAAWFVKALGRRAQEERLSLTCVATSHATEILAAEVGLEVTALDDVGAIDLTVDGADEIGPGLSLIKGGGAALLREKLVWEASRRCVVIGDAAKAVPTLGAFPLPVEVVAFGHATTAERIRQALRALNLPDDARLRVADGAPVRTDGGGVIYDLPLRRIEDPQALGSALKMITGVVEHGLFLSLAAEGLIASPGGPRRVLP